MSNRIKLLQAHPDAYKAVMGLENYVVNSGLNKTHLELIKIRASQINGCAYCLDMHTRDALKHGESQQRIFVLNAWRDTSFFTSEEQAVLALTEEITQISHAGVSDKTYEQAASVLGDDYLAKVIMAITVINVWNRISVSTRLEPAKAIA
ncbi:carboxymuconolactone decarboxylase family protein [Mucilaginibacter antarcticus]|uniref:Carboxymuconolactone decarboxylase family protein n=1 Tax=Mucilaginibacter antarcticus TaxID=1855725 RepID=A0ABW5XU37_9SPHI